MHRRAISRAFVTTAVVVTGLASCGTERGADVVAADEQDSVLVEEDPGTGEESPGEEQADEPAGKATLGDAVALGPWEVKVTELLLDADAQIKAANQFNDRAAGRYVLATYEATYNGSERTADIWADLTWSFTTTDQQIHDTALAVTAADDESWPTEARTGGTVRGQVVFDLPVAKTKGGILSVEAYDDNFDTVYANFAVE